jgi:hypothetical protein
MQVLYRGGEGEVWWLSDAQEAAKWCGLGLLWTIQVVMNEGGRGMGG